jgi:glycosyltransferase involved in cell wall biosynthesis
VTEPPKIAIVVPTRNRVHTLPRAVESVLTQSEPDFELIIVDDGSTDGTDCYLRGLPDTRIRTLGADAARASSTGDGVSAARNRGLQAARAEIVAFLDSDDACRPDRLAATLAVFDRDPDIVCVLASSLRHDRAKSEAARMPDIKLAPRICEWTLLCDLFPAAASGMAVRRAEALAIGGFNPSLSYAEDREFLIRLAPRGSFQLMSDVLWEKFVSPDSLSLAGTETGRGMLAFIEGCPAYRTRYPKLASYLATKVLISDLRLRLWSAFRRDLDAFRAAGLLAGGPVRLLRNHREVRRYRRHTMSGEALAAITDPPQSWR